jgi:hypothetical protein
VTLTNSITHIELQTINTLLQGYSKQCRTEGGWGFKPLPPPEILKALQNRAKLNPIVKMLKIAEFRTPNPQDVRKKDSKILKLQPIRNYFTLTMTNKLVVIMNSLKVPKIKKILLYKTKFLSPNYSCLQKP